ncbi:MATE family efflux transporter [Halococcoides cellulosivorans]|uniref:Multidrug-efflux transporter n=1 Tax=Halococcoides cellulosivorans TaxID=1679096 RepID=A0A2R4X4A3_9EURY|nr:MATE family efflux transporter [Halococcoides cellulosivorans]
MFDLAWPIVVIQLLQVAYNLADTIFLGAYDPTAVAAISLAFPLLFFLISIAGGFTTAGSILVAQYTGSDSSESAGRIAGQTVSFVALLSIVLALLGGLVLDPALDLLPTDPETAATVIPQMATYLRIVFAGIPFIFGFYVFSSIMRGYGDTRTPMAIMLVTVALNVVLDPIAIFGFGPVPELGIEGAALASVFARGVATVAGLAILFGTSRGPAVGLADLRLERETVREIVSIGTPTAIEQSMTSSAMIILTVVVAQFGPAVAAGYGVVNRLVSLVLLPALGMGRATNTLVGQNLGAGKPDRAGRGVWIAARVVGGVMIVVAVIAALFPDPIVQIFLQAETEYTAESIRHGTTYLRIRAFEFAFMGVLQVVLGAFRGAGNTKIALAISIVTLWLVRVPVTWGLAIWAGWGPMGLWIGMAMGDIVAAFVAIPWFLRGTWRAAVIDEEPTTA